MNFRETMAYLTLEPGFEVKTTKKWIADNYSSIYGVADRIRVVSAKKILWGGYENSFMLLF